MPPRFALLFVGALALVGLAGGCENGSNSATTQGPIRPLMWSITKDGKTTYALGTMHVGIDPVRLPTLVWDTVDRARVLAVETDVSRIGEMPLRRADGSTLHGELGPIYWPKLEAVLGANVAASVDDFKPMIAATLVALHGLPHTPAIDTAIEQRAAQRHTRVVYLEPLETELDVLIQWMDARALRELIDDVALVDQTGQQMVVAYAAGDADAVLRITNSERQRWLSHGRTDAEYDAMMGDLLYRRNASWLAAIETLHAEGGGLVAVGAAHLVGPGSVLDLLAQRGYTVTRITR